MSAMVLVLIAKLCATMIAAVKLSTKKLILAIMTVRQTQAVKMVFAIVMKARDHRTTLLISNVHDLVNYWNFHYGIIVVISLTKALKATNSANKLEIL